MKMNEETMAIMNEKTRLNVILDTLVFGLQKRGGVSVYWYEFVSRMLKDPEVNLTLIRIRGNYVNDMFTSLDLSGANIIYESGDNLQLLRNISPKIAAQREPVVFQSTYLRVCKNKNVRNVVTIHDFTHQIYFQGVKRWLNTVQKNRAIKNADSIICISENTKRDLLKYYPRCSQDKISIVYNGANDDYRPLNEFIIPDSYREIEGEKYIIYVGDRFPYKNTDFLFEILARNSSFHLVLIGGSEFNEHEIELIKKLDENGIRRVHRFTKVLNETLNVLYNGAVALVFPSLYEGFGIPVLEAMKAGCPVIAFDNSSIPEVLNGSGILLENNDINGCMNELRKLENAAYRERIVKQQIGAAGKFSWDKAYAQLKNVYRDALNGGGGGTQQYMLNCCVLYILVLQPLRRWQHEYITKKNMPYLLQYGRK